MANQDPAFLWETAALRERKTRVHENAAVPAGAIPVAGEDIEWVTLREAHDETGIPLATIRKWARRRNVSTYVDVTEDPPLRMVDLAEIVARAAALGRDLPITPATPASTAAAAPVGTMIVPIAAWDKMLMQLGNLHEAGQQLADARERAAKAETEALFLRERLGELRRELAERDQAPDPPVAVPQAPPSEPADRSGTLRWRTLYRRFADRRR